MEINVSNLKTEVSNFNKLVEEYEKIYLNLYNELSSVSFFWKDNHANLFFEHISFEKLKISKSFEELITLKNQYQYIIEKYQTIGNRIIFDLNNRNDIINKFDTYISGIDRIVQSYESLDLSFCREFVSSINHQKTTLIKEKSQVGELKNKVIEMLNKIEEIEKEIKLKISSINIEILKETAINDFI